MCRTYKQRWQHTSPYEIKLTSKEVLLMEWCADKGNTVDTSVCEQLDGSYLGPLLLIRKSRDYVYGIWVYKALGIWKGYYRVKKSLVSYMKPWTEARNNKYMKYHSKLTYQLILKCEPKSGLSCRRQVVHPRPQTPQGESVAKPETPLLIILSIACKWGPWQHVQSVIRKAKSVDKNILGRWLKIETASQT